MVGYVHGVCAGRMMFIAFGGGVTELPSGWRCMLTFKTDRDVRGNLKKKKKKRKVVSCPFSWPGSRAMGFKCNLWLLHQSLRILFEKGFESHLSPRKWSTFFSSIKYWIAHCIDIKSIMNSLSLSLSHSPIYTSLEVIIGRSGFARWKVNLSIAWKMHLLSVFWEVLMMGIHLPGNYWKLNFNQICHGHNADIWC